uniref:Conserved domain protein n=1 Tax=Chlamydia pneumoniae TaxID=83558 RepID=A0A0F7WRW3_CHLPN|nr:Conserved domain protein [Chlamydia pneumoniae]
MIKKFFIYSLIFSCSFSAPLKGICNEDVSSQSRIEEDPEVLITQLNGLIETLIEEGKEIRNELQAISDGQKSSEEIEESCGTSDSEGLSEKTDEESSNEYVLDFFDSMVQRLEGISKMCQSGQVAQIIDCFNREFDIRNRELELKNRELELREKDLEFKKSILDWNKEKVSRELAFQREQDIKQTLMLLKK